MEAKIASEHATETRTIRLKTTAWRDVELLARITGQKVNELLHVAVCDLLDKHRPTVAEFGERLSAFLERNY